MQTAMTHRKGRLRWHSGFPGFSASPLRPLKLPCLSAIAAWL
jgi:hypothetical protein